MYKTQILIVEDEPILALDIMETLERHGFSDIHMVSSGEEALRHIERNRVSLVLMDIYLQGSLDGVQTVELLKKHGDFPVIYLTASTDDATMQRAKITAPFGYIHKPFKERELLVTIEMALYKHDIDEQLREREEQYRKFFEEDLTGNFIARADGALTACNPAFLRLFGFGSVEAALGANLGERFPEGHSWETFLRAVRDRGKLEYFESELRALDGTIIYTVGNFIGRFDGEGVLAHIHGYIFDDTRRKTLEQQFLQSQKMEAIGRLAGGIAHDFNNLLAVISGYSELLASHLRPEDPLSKDVSAIVHASEQASMLTRQLLAFSRNSVMRMEIVNINTVIAGMESMLQRLIGAAITLKTSLAPRAWKVEVDPGQIEQVIMNLVINARDAMAKGGTLTVSTASEVIRDDPALHFIVRPGAYTVLSVEDTGTGMDEATISRIFEPFFTTKPKGEGTGLGLSTVYGIVTQCGGGIRVTSAPGAGTRFDVYLPRASRTDARTAPSTEAAHPALGTETVLIVEDESVIRSLIARLLRMSGYTAIETADGESALALIGEREGNVDLLIIDMVMPGMSGGDFSRKAAERFPDIKKLFISGYVDAKVMEAVEPESRGNFLQKPFKSDQFIARVREILDRPGNTRPR
ncbi:MAG: hybrid sensor histidine kinase/response regulator [Spirochaetes bacterium]|nr:MAG: hybrid sensor histidine kinase/response regulator [Spirochaetota bacterium]